jgi:hypothetical protein
VQEFRPPRRAAGDRLGRAPIIVQAAAPVNANAPAAEAEARGDASRAAG